MFRRAAQSTSGVLLAKAWIHTPDQYKVVHDRRERPVGIKGKERTGALSPGMGVRNERPMRRAVHAFASDPRDTKRLTDLPGVEFESDLPADPLTRIFYQRKASHALFQGTYEDPSQRDLDRVELRNRTTLRRRYGYGITTATYDFCHRVREGGDLRKRFVEVPATAETKGLARILHNHGLVSGFRDFFNDRAFVVELKYFQNEHVLQCIEPANFNMEQELDWTPKAVRGLATTAGRHSKIRVFALRTWDGRILDNFEASAEGIGGRGLMMAY